MKQWFEKGYWLQEFKLNLLTFLTISLAIVLGLWLGLKVISFVLRNLS